MTPPEAGGATPQKPEGDEAEQDLGLSLMEGLTKDEPDPVLAAAQTLLTKEMLRVSVWRHEAELLQDVKEHIFDSQSSIIWVDAPTSKIRVLQDQVKIVSALLAQTNITKYCLVMPVGGRLDVLSAMYGKLREVFPGPKHAVFAIQLFTSSTQSQRATPQYVLYVAGPGGSTRSEAPMAVSLASCRGKPFEGLRLRCTDPNCPLRPEGERGDSRHDPAPDGVWRHDPAPDAEIHVDDREGGQDDDGAFGEDANTLEEDEITMALADEAGVDDSEGKKKYLVDLFTFSRPVAFYQRILSQVAGASHHDHLIALSRSAHPSLLVAARASSLSVHALMIASDHQAGHGHKLLTNMLYTRVWAEAKRTTTAPKRVRSAALTFIDADAPPPCEQTMRLHDVEPGESSWRTGLNKFPASLGTLCTKLLQQQLDQYQLTVCCSPGSEARVLTSRRHLREGEEICPASALLYDDAKALEAVLTANRYLADRVVKVSGVLPKDDDHGPMNIFAVLVGAARYATHYGGLRRGGPNCCLHVNPAAGPTDEFLVLRVATRNKQGISAGSPVCLNFGLGYDATAVANYIDDTDDPASKKYRGALDEYFKKVDSEESEKRNTEANVWPLAFRERPSTPSVRRGWRRDPTKPSRSKGGWRRDPAKPFRSKGGWRHDPAKPSHSKGGWRHEGVE